MRYNKLVRDKIPEIIIEKGGTPITHVADDKEYWEKLKEKLTEEVGEFLESETIEEMADIHEVLEAIMDYKKFDQAEFSKIKEDKVSERGAFKERIILEES